MITSVSVIFAFVCFSPNNTFLIDGLFLYFPLFKVSLLLIRDVPRNKWSGLQQGGLSHL